MPALFGATGWLVTGFVLLAAEMFLPGVYLLFLGIGAVAIGVNLLFIPGLSIVSQLIGFAVVSAAATLIGYRWYGSRPSTDASPLNTRTDRLVGRRAVLSEAIVNGRGRVQLDDGWWSVEGPDMPAGAPVIILSAEGALLRVEAERDA
ncbi:NfeD family protein [Aureimonas altamirensis]|uniref:NfeD family protein n=1 Tax=Aureimonas altamirensis TaxID=370622 RepID=UPI000689CF8E|nr:NfeD family protein [Aureimonas altamirensis]